MALGNRLVQNIDLTANADGLLRLIQALGKDASKFAETLAKAGGDTKGIQKTSRQLATVLKQAQNLQNVLDAITTKRSGKLLSDLEVQRLGRAVGEVGKLRQGMDQISTASGVLDKRLSEVNKRFAELGKAGRTPSGRDLSKQLRLQEAQRDIQAIERQLKSLNTSALSTPSKGASADMRQLKLQIDAAYQSFQKFSTNRSTINFKPKIDELNVLLAKYRELIRLENLEAKSNSARAIQAQNTAQKIIAASDAERAASLRRQSNRFSFEGVGPNASMAAAAEDRLAVATAKRLRIINMINEAQARGAPLRSVERLNQLYANLEKTMAADLALIKQINRELANTPEARGKRINEYLFGDGGAAFSKRIAGAALISTGVFAAINAVQNSLRFIVEFESALKTLQAVSGSTDGQMVKLAESINAVARQSTYSTMEITKAATVIAQAGYAAGELDTVLKGAITLSTASGSTPQEAVETLTSALGSFRMQASDTEAVVDSMVTALNRSKLTINQVQLALQYAGATAKENNVSFNELLTITASMAQAGIKSGSTIGTGLRQLLVDFKTPSEDLKNQLKDLGLTVADIDVKALGFAEVVRRLSTAGFDATAAYEGLEVRAAAAFLAFKNQLPMYDQLALTIAEGGAAAEAQAVALDSLGAQFNVLKNVLGEVVTILAQPFVDALKGTLVLVNSLLMPLTNMLSLFGDLAGGSNILSNALRILAGVGIGALLGGPLGALIGGFFGLASAIGSSNSAMDASRTAFAEADAAYNSQITRVEAVESAIQNLIERQAVLQGNSSALAVETVNLSKQFEDLRITLNGTEDDYNNLLSTMIRYSAEQRRIQGEMALARKTTAEVALEAARGNLSNNYSQKLAAAGELRSAQGQALGNKDPNLFGEINSAFGSNDITYVSRVLSKINKLNSANNQVFAQTIQGLQDRLGYLQEIRKYESEIALADKQVQMSNITSDATYTSQEERTYRARGNVARGITANQEKAGSGDALIANTIAELDKDIALLKNMAAKFKATSQEWYAIQGLISEKEAVKARVRSEIRKTTEAEGKDKTPAYTGTPQTDAKEAARLATARGFRAGAVGPNGVSRGPGHRDGRAVDINLNGVRVEAGNERAKAKMDKLALDYQKAGYTVLWNKKWYKPNGKIVPIPASWGDHTDHLHVEAPEYGIKVTGQGSIGSAANTAEEQQERDEFNLRKAVAGNRLGAAEAGLSTVIKQGKAGMYSPTELRERFNTQLNEYLVAALNKFDVDNPVDDLTSAALEQRSLAREELKKQLEEKVDGFNADFNRAVADYAVEQFDNVMDAIEQDLKSNLYAAETGVRAADLIAQRANSPLNKNRNADAGTQYYLQKQAERERLNADKNIVSLRGFAEQQTQRNINSLEYQANQIPEDQRGGAEYLSLQAKIREERAKLNEQMRETAALQDSINARTQTFVALPLNERLQYGARAWAENNGVMDTYQDMLANNLGPALDTVSSGLGDMFTKLIQGKSTLKQALAGFIQAIGQFVTQLIAKALALAAIKWFLQMIGVDIGGVSAGTSTGSGVGGSIIGGFGKVFNPRGQITGGLAGKPMKFMGGGSTNPYISQGVSNRDGVPAYLAQGEYVMRKKAVDDIGRPIMDQINRHGAKAVAGLGGNTVVAPQARQETNIYLIKPEEKPTLGKNDVLITIQDDILQGGQTKQLIRQVAQGG